MAVGGVFGDFVALSGDRLDYEPTMDIGKIFVERCNSEESKSEAIVATEILIMLMKSTSIRTVQGLDDMINDAVRQMRQTDRANCSVKSACDIFQRFITLAVLDNPGDFEEVKKVLLDRAYIFLNKVIFGFFKFSFSAGLCYLQISIALNVHSFWLFLNKWDSVFSFCRLTDTGK